MDNIIFTHERIGENHEKKILIEFIIILSFFVAAKSAKAVRVCRGADCYTYNSHWLSEEGWGDEVTDLSNAENVYCNVVGSESGYAPPFYELRWIKPNGEREYNLGTHITKVYKYSSGIMVGFYGWMVINDIYREPGEWHVQHWAEGTLVGGTWGWHELFDEPFIIPPRADLVISPEALVTLDVIDSFNAPAWWPMGLAFDGTHLWCLALNTPNPTTIYKLDTDGNVVNTIPSPHGNCEGLAYDGVYLWSSDPIHEKIYRFDTSGNVVSSFDFPVVGGIAYDGEHLWCVGTDIIWERLYKLDTSGNIIASFNAPESSVFSYYGITYHNNLLWISVRSSLLGEEKILKVDTLGNLIDAFYSPGDTPYGLAFNGDRLWHSDSHDKLIFQLDYRFAAPIGSSKSRRFTIASSGSLNLVIENITISGPDAIDLSLVNDTCSNQTVLPSESCTVDVLFLPYTTGNKSALMEIPSNDPLSPTVVKLNAVGVEAVGCEGDFDHDADVDGTDLALLVAGYGSVYDEADVGILASDMGRSDCFAP